ncbi:hypothetical protein ACVJDU_002768 [Bradyrhizobium diazoefficiens]
MQTTLADVDLAADQCAALRGVMMPFDNFAR